MEPKLSSIATLPGQATVVTTLAEAGAAAVRAPAVVVVGEVVAQRVVA